MALVRLIAIAAAVTGLGSVQAAPEAQAFGKPLDCANAPASARVLEDASILSKPGDLGWALTQMSRIGYPGKRPAAPADLKYATTSASLLKSGSVVAAKMANDEARALSRAYATSFGDSFEALLTVITQPVAHASYPTSVLAEGEVRNGKGQHTHGVDMEAASSKLVDIIQRAQAAKVALGPIYEKPVVRYYILANGFEDAVALRAASKGVCALKLDDAGLKKLNVSARFMAMPGREAAASEVSK